MPQFRIQRETPLMHPYLEEMQDRIVGGTSMQMKSLAAAVSGGGQGASGHGNAVEEGRDGGSVRFGW